MSIRGPVIALATLVLLTGCGRGVSSCVRALEHHPPPFSAARELPAAKSLELSPRPTSDDLGAAAHDSHHNGIGHKLTEESLKKLGEEGVKHRDNDDQKR
jgi:hypothetical protein